MSEIEFKDIQGIIISGYKKKPASCFLLIQITNKIEARHWLNQLIPEITNGEKKSRQHAIQIAFTYKGLSTLGLSKESLETFAREFKEGMVAEHRSRILGDLGNSDPKRWQWGN